MYIFDENLDILWLQDGSNNNIKNHLKENDDSDLILKLLNKNTSINYDSLKSNNFISYYDSTNFTNIIRNQKTHQIKIDEILSGNISRFLVCHTIKIH